MRSKKTGPAVRRGVVLILAFILTADVLPAIERRGATVRVGLKNGMSVQGELLSVGASSLLVLERTGTESSIDLQDVMSLRVTARKRFPAAFVGFGAGAAIGYATGPGPSGWPHDEDTRVLNNIGRGLLWGAIGALTVSFIVRRPHHELPLYILLEGLTAEETQMALAKVRPYARDPE